MRAASDLFGAPLVLRTGSARGWAVAQLRKHGHAIDPRLRGRSPVVALYTDPDTVRGVLIRRLASGRLSVVRYGTLTRAEIAFLHTLASEVAR